MNSNISGHASGAKLQSGDFTSGFLPRGQWLEEFFLTLEHLAPAVPKRREGAGVAGRVLDHGVAQEMMQCCQETQLINKELGY